MSFFLHLWLNFIILLVRLQGMDCFRNVTMTVDPPYVENGKHVTLGCHYDLEGEPLYSVKWYRGTFEFYRYSPSENPPKKIFTYPGFHVDLAYSNATAVFLRNVGFGLGGNISCEVTTDAPSFKTRHAKAYLQVMSRPRDRPELHVNKDKYNVGDTLLANCTSFPSKPPASLSFLINNSPVRISAETYTHHYPTADNLYYSTANLSMVLFPGDFIDGGQILLKCSSRIDRFYEEFTEVRIGSRSGEPIPERVQSPSGRSRSSMIFTPTWTALAVICGTLISSQFLQDISSRVTSLILDVSRFLIIFTDFTIVSFFFSFRLLLSFNGAGWKENEKSNIN